MATIYNSDLSKELRDGSKAQITDTLPSKLGNEVIPVMEVNPKMLRYCDLVKSVIATNTTSSTIVTLSSDKDFYLCGGALSVVKDVTSPSTTSAIAITNFGDSSATNFLAIVGLTLTIQENCTSIDLARPIRLARGSSITLTNASATANVSSRASIWGYYIDNSSA
jgi:hypothetical protein